MSLWSIQHYHYVNLSRGNLCGHAATAQPRGYCRIQSTKCEQKDWNAVIDGAGPDLLTMIAIGSQVLVHDMSERDRETRAMWQGLAWIRFCFAKELGRECSAERLSFGRGGKPMLQYFERQHASGATRHSRHTIRYYAKYNLGLPILLVSCWGFEKPGV